jgi:hypothetical protein
MAWHDSLFQDFFAKLMPDKIFIIKQSVKINEVFVICVAYRTFVGTATSHWDCPTLRSDPVKEKNAAA